MVAHDFVDVCELLIVDPTISSLLKSPTPGVGMTTAALVVESKFHARAVLGGTLVLEIDALDRGPRPRTELRLRAVSVRPSFRSILSGGRSRQMGTLVHSSVQQLARSIAGALSPSQRPAPFSSNPVDQWIEELRTRDQQHKP